jgi:tagaturonate reductase
MNESIGLLLRTLIAPPPLPPRAALHAPGFAGDLTARVAALVSGQPYPVRVRGRQGGVDIDETLQANAIRGALQAATQWPQVRAAVLAAQVILSNTGDTGYALDAADSPAMLAVDGGVPQSFPAKLLVLLYGRWQERPDDPLTLLPCELVQDNGDVLRQLLIRLAQRWGLSQTFGVWLQQHCVWANSLVDRIVSQALEPVGAVAHRSRPCSAAGMAWA